MQPITERRTNTRYALNCPVHYRVARKGTAVRFGTGMTCDMSAEGLSFRCRKALPLGAHAEISIDWPAKHDDGEFVTLQLTGFVVRSDDHRTAVRVTSHRFKVEPAALQLSATA